MTGMTHRDQFDEGYTNGYRDGFFKGSGSGYQKGYAQGRQDVLSRMEDKAFLDAVGEMFVRFYREYYCSGDGDDRSDGEM